MADTSATGAQGAPSPKSHNTKAIQLLPERWAENCPPGLGQMTLAIAAASMLAKSRGDAHAEADLALTTYISLGVTAAVAFITLGYVLGLTGFNSYGKILLDRVRDTEYNWQHHTLRSFLEVSLLRASTFGS